MEVLEQNQTLSSLKHLVSLYDEKPLEALSKISRLNNQSEFFSGYLREYILNRDIKSVHRRIEKYMRLRSNLVERPFVRLVAIDSDLMVMHEGLVAQGSEDHIWIHVREVLSWAFSKKAKWILMYHNHILKDVEPSSADIRFTRHLINAMNQLDLCLWDHIIVNTVDSYSFRKNCYLF